MKLILDLFNSNKKINSVLILMCVYAVSLLIIRAKITQSIFLFFLMWNLFLGLIPYFLMLYLKMNDNYTKSKIKMYATTVIWLAFLPNSFYIVTDLVHLSLSHASTFWYDLTIISSFAFIGFFLGIQSIFLFEKIIVNNFHKKIQIIIVPAVCLLSGFGIYLGRILRYNSWDIISHPVKLFSDIGTQLTTYNSMLFSLHFGILIYLFYTSKKLILTIKSN